jgi:hypothetical protein
MDGLLATACCLWIFWGIIQSAGFLLRLLVGILQVVIPFILSAALLFGIIALVILVTLVEWITGKKLISSDSLFERAMQKKPSVGVFSTMPKRRADDDDDDFDDDDDDFDDDDDDDFIEKPKRKNKNKRAPSPLEDDAPMSLRDLLGSDGELPPNWEEKAPPRRKRKS